MDAFISSCFFHMTGDNTLTRNVLRTDGFVSSPAYAGRGVRFSALRFEVKQSDKGGRDGRWRIGWSSRVTRLFLLISFV